MNKRTKTLEDKGTKTMFNKPINKKLVGVVAGVTALGASLGLTAPAFAQQDPGSRQAPTAEQIEKRLAHLEDRVANGQISAERAAEIREAIESGEFRGLRGKRGRLSPEQRKARAEYLAELLNVTVDDLKAAKQAGQSVADLAEANGVNVQTVIDTLVAKATERVNSKLADGKIDQEKADRILENLEERVTARVNGERPERGDGHGKRGGPGRG